jgi:hypothetical protein
MTNQYDAVSPGKVTDDCGLVASVSMVYVDSLGLKSLLGYDAVLIGIC